MNIFIFKTYDLISIAPELFLLLNLLLSVVYFSAYAGRHVHASYFMTLYYYLGLYIVGAFCLTIYIATIIPAPTVFLAGYIIHDSLAIYAKLTIFILTLLVGLISRPYFKIYPFRAFEYIIIAGLSIIGSTLLVSSFDLIGFLATMELISFCLYVLAAARFNSAYAVESAVKYLIQGGFASGVFTFGSAMFFSMTGTTSYYAGQEIIINSPAIIHSYVFDFMYFFSTMLFMLSLPLFKIAVVPYHYWIAEVYEGAPLPITAYFSIVVKFVMTIALVRFVGTLFKFWMCYFKDVLIFYALLSIVIGTLAACTEQRIKRILAYSSINHSGYLLLGLIPANYGAFASVIEYALIYAFTNIIVFAFLMLCVVESKTISNKQLIFVSDLSQLSNSNYFYNICFSIAIFSLAGLPPFAGFFIKFNILYNFWIANPVEIVTFVVLYSIFATYYYLRFVKCIFFSTNLKGTELLVRDILNKFVILLLTTLNVIYPFLQVFINAICLKMGISATADTLPRLK